MEWEYGVVSFIDILGFSKIVKDDAKRNTPKNMITISTAISEAISQETKNIITLSFSDSIILSTQLKNNETISIFEKTIEIQQNLISKGILTRGAIAFGKHHQTHNTLYSEALIKAYTLETTKAKFPRVIIDKNLLDWLRHDPDTSTQHKETLGKILLQDKDNEIFLDYLNENIFEKSLHILNSSNKTITNEPGILDKYQWLDSYHNQKCMPNFPNLRCRAYTHGFKHFGTP